ncbi:GAP1-N1 domain-containing protein [Paraburkholderia fungorum]
MPVAMVGRLDHKAVNMSEGEKLDQALFGYSRGHRQIAASVRLPPADLYRLSAATDLATGARLAQDESYITGGGCEPERAPIRSSRHCRPTL